MNKKLIAILIISTIAAASMIMAVSNKTTAKENTRYIVDSSYDYYVEEGMKTNVYWLYSWHKDKKIWHLSDIRIDGGTNNYNLANLNSTYNSPNSALTLNFPWMHSQDNKYPLNGLTASYEAGITPFVNFTINTNYVPGKIINFEVRFDSNGDGTYETKALFSPYTTQWDQAANDNQHREEKIRAQFTGYSNGAPGNMVNGKIQMAFWRTDGITDNPGTAVNEDWLTIYCGAFTPAKESWVVLPFKWANLNPVAVIGPDPDQKPTDWWLEPPEDPTSPHYGQYVANYSVEMFGSDSYSPIGVNITSYMWEFSYKGHTGTGEIAKCNNHNFCKQQGHRYYYPGIYWIQLWVTDANGRVGWADHWINVTKDPGVIPEIETFLIEPNPALVDTEVDLTVFATDPDGHASLPIDVIYYKWDYDGDGIWDTNATESGIAKHIYEEPGTYTVKVAALDGPENNPDTLTGVKEMVLVIKENDGPIINFTVSTDFKKVNYPEHNSIMVIVGEEVSLDFSNCNDPDNLPGFDTGTHYSLQVKADFKDGLGAEIQYGNNVVYNYTYKEAGPYNMYSIAIIVSDGDIESPVTFYVIIDVPPKADAGPDQGTPRPGLEDLSTEDSVFFDGSASFDPNDDTDKNEIISGSEIDNCTYQWDFGDNTTSSLSNRPYANHSYSAPKTYEVLLTVTDPRGQISRDKAKVIVLSPNSPPVAVIDLTGGDTTYETFQEILFNSDSSFDPDNETNGRVLKWFWDFGDGNNSTEKNPSYRYADGNQYTVSLKVVDDRGDSSVVTTKVVQINNRKPEAKIRRLETTKWETKKPYTFTSVSTDMDGDVVFFEWTIDDVILDENTNEIEYTFDDSGPHKIVLTVKDDDGAVNDMSDEFSVYSIDIVKPVTEKSPGFELALVVMAIALVGLVATRRKRRV